MGKILLQLSRLVLPRQCHAIRSGNLHSNRLYHLARSINMAAHRMTLKTSQAAKPKKQRPFKCQRESSQLTATLPYGCIAWAITAKKSIAWPSAIQHGTALLGCAHLGQAVPCKTLVPLSTENYSPTGLSWQYWVLLSDPGPSWIVFGLAKPTLAQQHPARLSKAHQGPTQPISATLI